MGIYSTAHLVFGVPINEEDHPQFWSEVDPKYPEEKPTLDDWLVKHNKTAQRKLSYCGYGHYDSGEPEQAILMIAGDVKDSFSGDCYGPGPGIKFGLNPEIGGPLNARSTEEPSFKDVVKATDDLISAGIENVDFRDAAWYLVVSVG